VSAPPLLEPELLPLELPLLEPELLPLELPLLEPELLPPLLDPDPLPLLEPLLEPELLPVELPPSTVTSAKSAMEKWNDRFVVSPADTVSWYGCASVSVAGTGTGVPESPARTRGSTASPSSSPRERRTPRRSRLRPWRARASSRRPSSSRA
jgi:hypothetical protein